MFPYHTNTIIYSINDQSSVIDETPFTFMFAIKSGEMNSPPELEFIENKVVRKGSNFTFQLIGFDIDDDVLKYSVEPEMFSINKKGFVEGVLEQTGTFYLRFIVEDPQGLKDEQEVRVVVK